MGYRLLAAIAFPPHAIDRGARALLRPTGLGWLPAGPLIIAALTGLSASSAFTAVEAASIVLVPEPTTLAEVVDLRGTGRGGWVVFDGLVAETSHQAIVEVDVGGQPSSQPRHFYLARDPVDPAAVVVVRTPEGPDEFRRRTLRARLVADEALVEDALARLDRLPDGLEIERRWYLDELGVAAPAEPAPLTPGELLGGGPAAGEEVVVGGRLPWAHAEIEGGHAYLLADPDGGAAILLRSPHPPDAVPVRLDGMAISDPSNLRAALAGWGIEEALGDARYSRERVFVPGLRPPPIEVSPWPAITLGALTLVLAAGWLIGYPVFRRSGGPLRPAAAGPLPAGGQLPVEILGTLPTPHGPVRLRDENGFLGRMPMAEVARTKWRYWGARLGDYRRDVEDALRSEREVGEGDRLVVHSPLGSVLTTVEPEGGSPVEAEPGDLYSARRRRPALRLRGVGLDAILAFREAAERDRAIAELRRQPA